MPDTSARRSIRLLPHTVAPADEQLAASIALLAGLERSGMPAMRWYQFGPPALLLGSSQRLDEIDLRACAAAHVAVHKRRSGGGAVLSESLLLLDVALPPDDPLFSADVTQSYRWLGEVWAAALGRLGIAARVLDIASARADTQALDRLLRRVCYGGQSPFEVLAGARKVVGLAQVRRRAGALLQAGVYLNWAPGRTAALTAATADERARLADQLGLRVAGLADLSGGTAPTIGEVMRAFARALEQVASLSPETSEWTGEERQAQRSEIAHYAALHGSD